METAIKAGVKMNTKTRRPSFMRAIIARIAWVWDRFVFYVIYRGERLRPEVAERIERSIANAKNGKNISPTFKSGKDAIQWLKAKKS